MKLGEIKIEAIKLMFTNYNFDLHIEDLTRLISDENYGSYLVNMNGAIARALDRIENACVVPVKSYKVLNDDLEYGEIFSRFDTKKIEDFYLIDRVVVEDNYHYDGDTEFILEGDNLLLDKNINKYTILYYPKLKTIDETKSDETELEIPNNIARLIPYFVKGELYQEEEPDIAANARNLFEASLDDLKIQKQSKQNYVVNVF